MNGWKPSIVVHKYPLRMIRVLWYSQDGSPWCPAEYDTVLSWGRKVISSRRQNINHNTCTQRSEEAWSQSLPRWRCLSLKWQRFDKVIIEMIYKTACEAGQSYVCRSDTASSQEIRHLVVRREFLTRQISSAGATQAVEEESTTLVHRAFQEGAESISITMDAHETWAKRGRLWNQGPDEETIEMTCNHLGVLEYILALQRRHSY